MTYRNLISICSPLNVVGKEPETIGSLQQDSRKVRENDVFVAVQGLTVDGHNYIYNVVQKGASVVICEKGELLESIPDDIKTTFIQVVSTRPLVGVLAQAFAENPSRVLDTVAVTGTNGKTTVATLIWQILMEMDIESGLLGTVAKQFGSLREESKLTTSDPIELATDMKKMVDSGCKSLSMEVSSHALEQDRVAGIDLDVAVFTNLSHDHLDYHKDMVQYAAAKKRLFQALSPKSTAVVNVDDPYGHEMINECQAKIIDFGFHSDASIHCELLESGQSGSKLRVDDTEILTPLVGGFNAYNAAEAFLACTALGHDPKKVAEAMQHCRGPEGRLERVTPPDQLDSKPVVFVDYAHTPDALENVASALASVRRKGQVLTIVFGCGGNRDRNKRPVMARAAEQFGDRLIVTSDNPRDEDPATIIDDIEKGFSSDTAREIILNREDAIVRAIREAPAVSIVLIAGKGHETYQEVRGERLPFDDREVARRALDMFNQKNLSGEVN